MATCDFASDFIVSAVLSSKFDSAKKLCEMFFFENKSLFSFLYGLANLTLKNNCVMKNIIASIAFLEGFRQQEHIAHDLGLHIPSNDLNLILDQDAFIQRLKIEILDDDSQLRKFLFGNYYKKL